MAQTATAGNIPVICDVKISVKTVMLGNRQMSRGVFHQVPFVRPDFEDFKPDGQTKIIGYIDHWWDGCNPDSYTQTMPWRGSGGPSKHLLVIHAERLARCVIRTEVCRDHDIEAIDKLVVGLRKEAENLQNSVDKAAKALVNAENQLQARTTPGYDAKTYPGEVWLYEQRLQTSRNEDIKFNKKLQECRKQLENTLSCRKRQEQLDEFNLSLKDVPQLYIIT